MKRADVRRLVAYALCDVAEELRASGPEIWPDSTDSDRAAARAADAALDAVERALNRVADDMTTKKKTKIKKERSP